MEVNIFMFYTNKLLNKAFEIFIYNLEFKIFSHCYSITGGDLYLTIHSIALLLVKLV